MWKTLPGSPVSIMTLMDAARTRNGSKSAPKRCFFAYVLEPVLVLDQLFPGVGAAPRVLVRPPLLQQVAERLPEEAAGPAGRVEDSLVLLRVEDVDHQTDRGRAG